MYYDPKAHKGLNYQRYTQSKKKSSNIFVKKKLPKKIVITKKYQSIPKITPNLSLVAPQKF
jgi:hypothetical protein